MAQKLFRQALWQRAAYFRKLFCGETVTVHPVHALWSIYYSTVYGQSANRDVIHYLHSGLRGVIGTYEGRKRTWEGVIAYLHAGLRGVIATYEGCKPRWGA